LEKVDKIKYLLYKKLEEAKAPLDGMMEADYAELKLKVNDEIVKNFEYKAP